MGHHGGWLSCARGDARGGQRVRRPRARRVRRGAARRLLLRLPRRAGWDADPLPAKPDPPESDIVFIVESEQVEKDGKLARVPKLSESVRTARYIGIEIPRDLRELRPFGPNLLETWQGMVRSAFRNLFAQN